MTLEKKGCLTLRNCLVVGVPCFLMLMCAGVAWPLELPFYLLAGWIFYLKRTIPEITWNWEAITSGIAYLVLSVAGFHLVARSIAASRGMAWRGKWSVCISTLILLTFAVSLAIGGIVHQAAWLARADRWIGGNSSGRITKQIANARQLILAVRLFSADEGGRYPPRLDELLATGCLEGLENFEKLSTYVGDSSEPPAPWIYVRGLSDSAPADLPLIIAPRPFKGGKRVIGTNDTSVELMSPSSIRKQLPNWKAGYAALGIPLPEVLEEYDQPPPAK